MKTTRLLKELRELTRRLPGSEEYIMVHHPAFRVGKKPFVILGMQGSDETLSVNLGKMEQAELLEDERFSRTPYLGQHGWVTFRRNQTGEDELWELLEEGWRRVAPKRLRGAGG